jgi:hypothetical protein
LSNSSFLHIGVDRLPKAVHVNHDVPAFRRSPTFFFFGQLESLVMSLCKEISRGGLLYIARAPALALVLLEILERWGKLFN